MVFLNRDIKFGLSNIVTIKNPINNQYPRVSL